MFGNALAPDHTLNETPINTQSTASGPEQRPAKQNAIEGSSRWLAALPVFLVAVVIAAGLIGYSQQQSDRENRTRVAGLAKDHAHAIATNIERALSATQALATMVRQGKGTITDFDAVAGQMLQYYPGVSALELSPGGVIRYTVPLAGNEKAIGFDQLRDPLQSREALIARDARKLTLAGPMNLAQGGLGAVGRLPVFLEGAGGKPTFWGFTNVVIRFPEALVGARLPQLVEQGVNYELWRIQPDSGERQVIAASSSNPLVAPVDQNVELPYGDWTLSAAPVDGWGDPFGLWVKVTFGVVVSLLLGYVAMLVATLRTHRQQLEQIVGERTQTLAETNTALAHREALLQQILDTSSVAIFLVDQAGHITQANQRMAEMFRCPLDTLVGNEYVSLVHPAEREIGRQRMLALLASAIPSVAGDRLYCRADQSEFWGHLTGKRFHDASGEELGLIGVIADITERKASEQKLGQRNDLLSAIIQNFPGGVSVFDGDLRLAAYNDQFKQLLDLPESLFAGPDTCLEDFIRYNAEHGYYGPGDPERQIADRVARASNFQPRRAERVLPNGKSIEIRSMPLPEGGFVAVYVEITERKRAEEKLQLAASVFTHAREGIVITAADGMIVDVNQTFTRITGYSRDEALGNNPRLLQSGQHDESFYATMWRDLTEKGHWYGEIWNRRKNGEVYAQMQTISAVKNANGVIQHYVALFSDITALKEHERQLEHLAHYDALTSLPNRVLLADRMQQAKAQAQRRGQRLAVAYLDLDGFKEINDRHGHQAGDQLLMVLAQRMKQALREGDTLARLGGDEFVAVLLDLADISASAPMLTRLLAAAAEPVRIGEFVLQVSASLGVSFYPQAEDVDTDQLLRQADQAMYQAKLAGKNRYHVFDAEQDRSARGHHESLERIRLALTDAEFVLHYQPKVNMRTGTIIGAEALIRWQHPDQGLLMPAAFLPAIESDPLAVALGDWVIDTALTQMEEWQAVGLDISVSVNVGARQLQQPGFVARLRGLLTAHPRIRPGSLELEVLETSALEDLTLVSQLIEDCHAIGVSFALDDFGTGYSSLTYLKRLPVKVLKIDQSFVRDMLDDPDDLAILEGVLGLATAFRRQVIAEGVETVEHGEMLLQLGCELGQGYGIARPMPARELPRWSRDWRIDSSWEKVPSVSSVDLPLLFASAEHRAWIDAMESYLADQRGVPPPLDHHQCRFGQWLDGEGLSRHGAGSAFRAILPLHREVHALAAELCELHARQQSQQALVRLPELHGLRNALLEQLQKLVRESLR